ncbi:MAG: 4Fe-4S dicluster domain-containing protein [Clostridiales bacterium]|nr:4Fe-4S dicluster domain-containing protein [Clostridiales bacterium]
MIYCTFQDKQLSQLGFGAMRLPMKDGAIDEAQVERMVAAAMAQGVNYFDTAYPYHGGYSEIVMGRVLSKYPRESWYLASKYPGHQVVEKYDPAAVFEEQLKKCGVEYFDFYLLHNVCEASMEVYLDPRWGIIDYFREQKRLGRIRHLGFSSHGSVDNLRAFLDAAGDSMEFCQIQLNYLDWTLQDAKTKVELLNERHMPIWVMEPVRGGKLCKLSEADEAALRALRPEEGIPAWGFRFLQDIPGVAMILSGMSDIHQMEDNLRTFEARKPLTEGEAAELLRIAEGMKDSVPCTGCGYCMAGCPMELDIPKMIATYNELRIAPSTNAAMWLEFAPEEKQPSACIGCGACAASCPQGIDIPAVLSDLAQRLTAIPKWKDICKEREEAAKRLAGR